MTMASMLFPDPPRELPGGRAVRIALRTAHILTTGVLLGGHIFQQSPAELSPWLWAALLSGALLFATDLYASLSVLFELRGISVVIKLGLVALVPVYWDHRVSLLVVAVVIGGVSSHMPKRWRHRVVLFRGRAAKEPLSKVRARPGHRG